MRVCVCVRGSFDLNESDNGVINGTVRGNYHATRDSNGQNTKFEALCSGIFRWKYPIYALPSIVFRYTYISSNLFLEGLIIHESVCVCVLTEHVYTIHHAPAQLGLLFDIIQTLTLPAAFYLSNFHLESQTISICHSRLTRSTDFSAKYYSSNTRDFYKRYSQNWFIQRFVNCRIIQLHFMLD